MKDFLLHHQGVDISDDVEQTVRKVLTPLLLHCMRSSNTVIAERALEALRALETYRSPQLASALVPLFTTKNARVRQGILLLLRELDPDVDENWEIIRHGLCDESSIVRKLAVEAICFRTGVTKARRAPEVARFLLELVEHDADDEVRAVAALRVSRYLPKTEETMRRWCVWVKDPRHKGIQSIGARFLGECGAKAQFALPILLDALTTIPEQASKSIVALKLPPKMAIPLLISFLNHESWSVCHTSVEALAEYGAAARKALPALKIAVTHDEYGVQEAARLAIRRIERRSK